MDTGKPGIVSHPKLVNPNPARPAGIAGGTIVQSVIQDRIDPAHDLIRKMPTWAPDSELARLNQAIPPGPITLHGTLTAAMQAARDALDHISLVLTTSDYCPTAVLHPLIRVALIAAARIVTPLIPTDPEERVVNALAVVWRDADSQRQAFANFQTFRRRVYGLDAEMVAAANRQHKELKRQRADIPEGRLIERMIGAVATALQSATPDGGASSLSSDEGAKPKAQHSPGYTEWAQWLWNTYSGAAHAHSWPRLLPRVYGDGIVVTPGFVGNLLEVVGVTDVGLCAVIDRAQPGTAGTTAPVDTTSPV